MLKREIQFKDLDNNDVTETWYFNLSKAELAEMALRHGGAESLQALLRKMVEAQDGNAIVENFKMILLAAVGRRSDDGRRLIKTPEVRQDFEFSDAYNVLFMELMTDTTACVTFIKAIVPADLAEQTTTPVTQVELPPPAAAPAPLLSAEKLGDLSREKSAPKKFEDYTFEELQTMDQKTFLLLRARAGLT